MLYHPGTNTWTSTGSMTTGRKARPPPCSPDGQAHGRRDTLRLPHVNIGLASAELYTP